jgi:hypothetical protein
VNKLLDHDDLAVIRRVNNNASAVIGTLNKSSEAVGTMNAELAVIKNDDSGDMAGQKSKIFSGSEKNANDAIVKNKNKSSKKTPVKETNDIELL